MADIYKIDFAVLDSNDPKKIFILDLSSYIGTQESPAIFVTLPGYIDTFKIPYIPLYGSITILNSNNIGITQSTTGHSADLPDGVYQIKMAVCPYDELYHKVCYLRTTDLECKLNNLLLNYNCKGCIDDNEFNKDLIDIDILIMGAKAETTVCNISKATEKYQKALKKIESLNRKINCK